MSKAFKPFTQAPDTDLHSVDVVKAAIAYSTKLKARLDKLENYYFGDHDINSRQTQSGVNNKVVVNHASYITDVNVGYFLGSPVDYETSEGVNIEPIMDEYDRQVIADLDSEIARDVSIYGYAYEYVYTDEDSTIFSAHYDPRNVVLVRDNTVKQSKIGAIIYIPQTDDNGTIKSYTVYIADKEYVAEYTTEAEPKKLTEVKPKHAHAMGDVPVIEYRNNPARTGDFEGVIGLIDVYNILQSDRVNDKAQLVDAILALYGVSLTAQQVQDLRDNRVISSIPKDAKIEYIVKQLNESDAETLRTSIEKDIHKISKTPNMSDENFAGNSSGVALKYKLLAMEQNIKTKERYFERGLMERMAIYASFLKVKNNTEPITARDVDAKFTRSLPANDLEVSQMINNLTDHVDDETLISQLSFVRDASEVIERLKAEKEDEQASNADDISNLEEVEPIEPAKPAEPKPEITEE